MLECHSKRLFSVRAFGTYMAVLQFPYTVLVGASVNLFLLDRGSGQSLRTTSLKQSTKQNTNLSGKILQDQAFKAETDMGYVWYSTKIGRLLGLG